MRQLPGFQRFFRLIGRDAPIEQEIDAEIQFYLDQEAARLTGLGMPAAAAREEARRRFGDLGSTRARLARIDRGRRTKDPALRATQVDPLEALKAD